MWDTVEVSSGKGDATLKADQLYVGGKKSIAMMTAR